MSVAESTWTTPEPAPIPLEGPGLTRSELQIVLEELDHILASHHFVNSKRCQAFLRYAVSETLSGRRDLKERSIGVEVFERSPSYDTNQDPVVRMTAGEVRKRLALYYQGASHPPHLCIELPIGSYAPLFQWSPSPAALALELPVEPVASPEMVDQPVDEKNIRPRRLAKFAPSHRVSRASSAVLLLLLCATLLGWRMHLRSLPPQPIQEFWGGILATPSPVLVSIGQIRPTMAEIEPNVARSPIKRAMALQGAQGYPHEIAVTVFNDSVAMAKIASLLRSNGKQVTMRSESTTSLNDLDRGPFVLIGAFNNDWTILLSDPLRFHFNVDDQDGSEWIADREHAESKIGLVSPGSTSTVATLKSDYAIAARFYDQRTKQMVVIAAGLTPYGTRAAGDFLSDPGYLAEFDRSAPAGWTGKNMEVLIRTDLIDNEPGPPVVIDKAFW